MSDPRTPEPEAFREAAERLEQVRKGIPLDKVYAASGPNGWPDSRKWESGFLGDRATCAEAYLHFRAAARPVEDGEPVTEEWLESLGFVYTDEPTSRWELVYHDKHDDGEIVRHWFTVHDGNDDRPPAEQWWPMEYRQCGDDDVEDGVAIKPWLKRTTRGDILRAVAALGIPQPTGTEGG